MKLIDDTKSYVLDVIAGRHEPEGVRRLADFYWRGILIIAFLAIIGAVAYGIVDLLGVLNDLASTPDTAAPPPPALNRAILNATVEEFQTRQSQFSDPTSVPTSLIPDPSR